MMRKHIFLIMIACMLLVVGVVDADTYTNRTPPVNNITYVKTTSATTGYYGYFATNLSLSLTGSWAGTSWVSGGGAVGNQRIHIDLGNAYRIENVYYENAVNNGGTTNAGSGNFTFWGSNSSTAFATTTYATDTDWTQLTTNITKLVIHATANAADPHWFSVTNTGSYRYYAVKIADNYGNPTYIGLRRIALRTFEDTTPPASITGLTNQSIAACTGPINWNWTNPADADFALTQVYQNGAFLHNVTTNFDSWSGLSQSAAYEISTHTCDATGNCNTAWVNRTVTTEACPDVTPPASITNLTNSTSTCEQITFDWDNPTDADFNGTEYWMNNVKGTNFTTSDGSWILFGGLTGGTPYTFSTRTFDTSYNSNASFVNMTAVPTSCSPVTNFTSNVTVGTVYPMVVQFNDTSTNLPTTWNWSFGDGRWTNGTTRNVTYQYAVAGKYNVTLIANNSVGANTSIKTNYINLTSDNDDDLLVWMHMNGVQGSTVFNGEKGVAWTTMGAAKITNSTYVFGNASGDFTGSKSYIYTPSTPLLNMSTGAGEIEMWVRPTASAKDVSLIKRGNALQTAGWGVMHSTTSATSDGWVFWMGNDVTGATNTFTLPLNTWSHLVICADALGNNYVYVNGTLVATKTGMTANYDTVNPIYIGYRSAPVKYFEGYIDELRISRVQRFASNFTTPYAEYRGVLETVFPDINPNSTMRYKTNPDAPYPGAYIANQTDGGTRNRTIQLQNVSNTSFFLGEATFDPRYVQALSVQLNTSYYPTGMTLLSSGIDNVVGTVQWNVSKPTGFSIGTDRASIIDYTALYYNYSPPGDTVYTYFGYGFLINGSTDRRYPVHNFLQTPVTYGSWDFTGDFTASNTTPYVSQSINFNSSFTGAFPNRWNWSFGDGTFDDGLNNNISHSYSTTGLKTVTLTEYLWQNNSVQNVTLKTNYIDVLPNAPVANFTYNATSGCVPLYVALADTSTGSPTGRSWYMDATESETSTLQNPVATFSTPGIYSIRLWAYNGGGGSWKNMSNLLTAIDCSVPVANFSANATTVCVGNATQFNDTSTSGSAITGWLWSFGDSNVSSLQNVTYSYGYSGLFTVIMSASNAYGSDAETKTNYITVNDCIPPSVDFTYNATCGVGNLTVMFNDTSSSSVAFNESAWYWDLGEGTTSTDKNYTMEYGSPGVYTVSHGAGNIYGPGWISKGDLITVAVNGTYCNSSASVSTGYSEYVEKVPEDLPLNPMVAIVGLIIIALIVHKKHS